MDKVELEEKLKSFLKSLLDGEEATYLVALHLFQQKSGTKINVVIDSDRGVTIDTCARVSRAISRFLHNELMMEEKFSLEVTSPGVDQPLKFKRQYVKNLGRKVKVALQDNSIRKGKLLKVSKEAISLDEEVTKKSPSNKKRKIIETKRVEIPFSDIKKTSVLVSFK